MKFRERLVLFLATGFFCGTIPFAPGTVGTVIGLPLCYLIARLHWALAVVWVLLFIGLAIGLASAAEKILKQTDSPKIVIDEIAGLLVTFVGLPFTLTSAVFGFVIFRVFDILKPFPIRWLESKLSGGSGIVFDDVLAGAYANVVLRFALYIFGILSSQ